MPRRWSPCRHRRPQRHRPVPGSSSNGGIARTALTPNHALPQQRPTCGSTALAPSRPPPASRPTGRQPRAQAPQAQISRSPAEDPGFPSFRPPSPVPPRVLPPAVRILSRTSASVAVVKVSFLVSLGLRWIPPGSAPKLRSTSRRREPTAGSAGCSGLAAKNCPQPGGSSPPRDLPPSAGRCRDAPRWRVWGTQRLSLGPASPSRLRKPEGRPGNEQWTARLGAGPTCKFTCKPRESRASRTGSPGSCSASNRVPAVPCRAKRSCERRRLVSGSPRPWLVCSPLGPGEPGVPS